MITYVCMRMNLCTYHSVINLDIILDCSLTLHISGFQSNTSESLIRNCMINSIGLDDDDIKKVQLDKDNNVCLVQFNGVNSKYVFSIVCYFCSTILK